MKSHPRPWRFDEQVGTSNGHDGFILDANGQIVTAVNDAYPREGRMGTAHGRAVARQIAAAVNASQPATDEPVILFRSMDRWTDAERDEAASWFRVVQHRTHVPPGALVIGRYSMLPHYREMTVDLAFLGARPVNSTNDHAWIAHFGWYKRLQHRTMRTWDEDSLRDCPIDGPFVVKGATNSRKWNWDTHMFAETRSDAINVASRLRADGGLAGQRIVFREYIPLRHTERGIGGVPFAYEFRFFCWRHKVIASSYYWTPADEADIPVPTEARQLAEQIACEVAGCHDNGQPDWTIDGPRPVFYVLDIAQAENGSWLLVEVNDGQQSGLCQIPAAELYRNLKAAIAADSPEAIAAAARERLEARQARKGVADGTPAE